MGKWRGTKRPGNGAIVFSAPASVKRLANGQCLRRSKAAGVNGEAARGFDVQSEVTWRSNGAPPPPLAVLYKPLALAAPPPQPLFSLASSPSQTSALSSPLEPPVNMVDGAAKNGFGRCCRGQCGPPSPTHPASSQGEGGRLRQARRERRRGRRGPAEGPPSEQAAPRRRQRPRLEQALRRRRRHLGRRRRRLQRHDPHLPGLGLN